MPPPSALGERHRVGHDAGLLVGPQRPGPPHPALDLVEHERGADAVAGLARGGQHLRCQRVHAGLALHRLEQHGGGPLVDRLGDRLGGRRDGAEAGHQRRERRLLGLLRRRRERAVGAPVERAVHDDDVAARPCLADELERGLVGLRARVGEVHARRRASAPTSRSASRTIGAFVNRFETCISRAACSCTAATTARMAVPERADRDAGRGSPGTRRRRRPTSTQPEPRGELDRVARVGRRRARVTSAGRILVPMPASVNSSSSSECGWRPSMMCAKRDAAVDRVDAGLQLRPHAARRHGERRLDLVGRRLGDRPRPGRRRRAASPRRR